MTSEQEDDLFYVCSLIEYVARRTKNRRGTIAGALKKEGFIKQLKDARVNHCLSFEQVGEEIIAQYQIADGDFDTISHCKYPIPSYTDIGRLYSIMILDCAAPGTEVDTAIKIFSSVISDYISNFNSDCYYQSPSYLEESFKSGKLL